MPINKMERRNMSFVEIAKTFLNDQDLPHKFWDEVINTAYYICNRYLVKPFLGKTGNELYHDKIPSISHINAFGFKYYIVMIN